MPDIERYVRQLEKDPRGLVDYQKLFLKLEDPRKNFPLKEIAIRLAVFL